MPADNTASGSSGPEVPSRTSSRPQPPPPVHESVVLKNSKSTFGDSAVGSEQYADSPPRARITRSQGQSSFTPWPNVDPRRMITSEDEPAMEAVGLIEIVDNEQTMLIDGSGKVIPARNTPAIQASADWREVGKSTYQLRLQFTSKDTGLLEQNQALGTAVHVGEGVFLTAAHCLRWPDHYTSSTHTFSIHARSGSGVLFPPPNLNAMQTEFEVTVLRWPTQIEATAIMGNMPITGLLDKNLMIPEGYGFALLKGVNRSALAKLRNSMGFARPAVKPGDARGRPNSFVVRFVGVNAASEDYSKYRQDVNSYEDIQAAVQKLLPHQISMAAGAATKVVGDDPSYYRLANQGSPYERLRYKLPTVGGSSGCGIYDEDSKLLIAIHVKSELTVSSTGHFGPVNETTQNVAIPLTRISFLSFISAALIPELRGVGTAKGIELARLWEALI